jgi:hypothetical protein
MRRILDYAGMFPPANLPLEQAACNFQEYQRHSHADFLGSFIAPLYRWKDVGQADSLPAPASLLVRDTEIGPGLQKIDAASIEVILPAGSVREIVMLLEDSFPGRIFVELNWRQPYHPLMSLLAKTSSRFGVKLRTGGVTPDTVPPSDAVADFLLAAAALKLPLKATAGLHVPVPNHDPAVGARMHGFLNFFSAGFLAYTGRADRKGIIHVLDNFSYDDFTFGPDAMRCGAVNFSLDEITQLRTRWLLSFGSCSFLEPIQHLESHGLI